MSTVNNANKNTEVISESVLALQGLDNTDLFYNQQVRYEGRSWELSIGSGESNFKIVGLINNENLQFKVSNDYGDLGSESVFAQGVNKIKDFLNTIGKNIPVVNAMAKIGESAGKDISTLFGREDAFSDTLEAFKSAAKDSMDKLGKGIKNAPNIAKNTLNTLGLPADRLTSHSLQEIALGNLVSPFDGVKTYGGSTGSVPTVQLKGYVFHKKDTRNVIDFLINCIKNISGETITTTGGMFGLQISPNKYVPQLGNLKMLSTKSVSGTWDLRLGRLRYYNVLVTDFDFELSPYRAIEGWNIPTNQSGDPTPILANDPYMATFSISFTFANRSLPEDIINLLESYS